MQKNRELGHMGDGVYLSHDGYQHWLAVNHHENKVVALDQGVAVVTCIVLLTDIFGDGLLDFLQRTVDNMRKDQEPSTEEGAN